VVSHHVLQPGWSWKGHAQPQVGTASCELYHRRVVLSGRMGVRTDEGEEVVIGPNQVFDLPPGHLTWVEGDEELVMVDWAGGAGFDVQPGESTRVMATILFTDMVGSTALKPAICGHARTDGLATDGEPGTDALAGMSKIVFSSTSTEPLSWANTELVSQDAVVAVREMKDEGSKSMRTIGSFAVCRSLLRAGLVDRFRVVVFPVITGSSGRDRIYDGYPDVSLDLVSNRTFDGRLQLLDYIPARARRATRHQQGRHLKGRSRRLPGKRGRGDLPRRAGP
jgi:dihydrofolate reductase